MENYWLVCADAQAAKRAAVLSTVATGRRTTGRLERGLGARTTVPVSRAEARELAELVATGGFVANPALLEEACREVLKNGPD